MSALSGTVKLPGLGEVKKVYVLGGVGLVAVIVAVAYYRHRNAAPATPDTTTNPVDYSTTDTGYSTGTGAGSGGGGSGDGTPVPWPWGYDANGNPLPAPVPGGTANPGGAINTNAEWSAQAIGLLENGGITTEVANAAITGVLGGIGVTSDQEALFLRAVGALGDPPQGYPKPIRLVAPPSEPNPNPEPGTSGGATAGHKAPGKVTGLKAASKTETTVKLTWNTVPDARGYTVYRNGARITTVVYGTAQMSNLKPNTSYTFAVQTVGFDGKVSALASINVRTLTDKRALLLVRASAPHKK